MNRLFRLSLYLLHTKNTCVNGQFKHVGGSLDSKASETMRGVCVNGIVYRRHKAEERGRKKPRRVRVVHPREARLGIADERQVVHARVHHYGGFSPSPESTTLAPHAHRGIEVGVAHDVGRSSYNTRLVHSFLTRFEFLRYAKLHHIQLIVCTKVVA